MPWKECSVMDVEQTRSQEAKAKFSTGNHVQISQSIALL
jgi:hypothetical protein